jgi:hypothetical protein
MFDTIKAEVAAVAVVASLAVGFGAGWAINGWRLGTKVATLEGVVETQKQSIATLEGANQRCAAGVADVKGAVKAIADDAAARTAAAAAAMKAAEKGAAEHLAAAKDAMSRPPAAPGTECDRAAAEASAYAKKRKGAP